jgi:hypothetical protein
LVLEIAVGTAIGVIVGGLVLHFFRSDPASVKNFLNAGTSVLKDLWFLVINLAVIALVAWVFYLLWHSFLGLSMELPLFFIISCGLMYFASLLFKLIDLKFKDRNWLRVIFFIFVIFCFMASPLIFFLIVSTSGLLTNKTYLL